MRRRRATPKDPIVLYGSFSGTVATGTVRSIPLADANNFFTDTNGKFKWAGTIVGPVFNIVGYYPITTQYSFVIRTDVYVLPQGEDFNAGGVYVNERERLKPYLWLSEVHSGGLNDPMDIVFMPRTARSLIVGGRILVVFQVVYTSDTTDALSLDVVMTGNFINR